MSTPKICFGKEVSDRKASATSPVTLGTYEGYFLPVQESQC